jgi:hypothetical protein
MLAKLMNMMITKRIFLPLANGFFADRTNHSGQCLVFLKKNGKWKNEGKLTQSTGLKLMSLIMKIEVQYNLSKG